MTRIEIRIIVFLLTHHHVVSSFTSVKLFHIIYMSMLHMFALIFFFIISRNKFVEFDMKPVCKKCYEKFPLELKKRLKKLAETLGRK